MKTKELIKQLIINFQHSLPMDVLPRESSLPIDSKKIITIPGVRHCGKSSLLLLVINQLLQQGISKERILFLQFDDERLRFNAQNLDEILQAYRELYPNIPLQDIYIFFDEIQMAHNWQPFIRRIYEKECKNIYITGSNSRMLSSELPTSLRGRTLQCEQFPLSFKEYCQFSQVDTNYCVDTNQAKIINAFKEFLKSGAFPKVALSQQIYKERILQEHFFFILYKDLIEQCEMRNTVPVRNFIKRVMANLTRPTSINSIYNEMKSQGISVGKNTLYDLIEQMEAINLFFPVARHNQPLIKDNNGDKKYYCIDTGLKHILVNSQNEDDEIRLENMVFVHLRRTLPLQKTIHYYKEKKECDFLIADSRQVTQLIQVSWDIHNKETLQREIDGLLEASLATGCRNLTIITLDEERSITEQGKEIQIIPAWKWMLT